MNIIARKTHGMFSDRWGDNSVCYVTVKLVARRAAVVLLPLPVCGVQLRGTLWEWHSWGFAMSFTYFCSDE